MIVLAGALKVVGLLVSTAVYVSGLRENEASFFGNIIPLCKSIISSAIHTKTQHSNLWTFRFILCRYMFRSVILTIRRRWNESERAKVSVLWFCVDWAVDWLNLCFISFSFHVTSWMLYIMICDFINEYI